MRREIIRNKSKLNVNECFEGEPLEITLARITETKEPIEMTDSLIFTERDEGVKPEFDIRTDRWAIAQKAMGAVAKEAIAKRKGVKPEEGAALEGNEGKVPEQSTEIKES